MTEREQSLQRQIDALLDDLEPLAAERDALKAQLAALTAEHESAARAAEERFERIASYASDAAAFRSEDAGGPLSIIEGMARAAIAEVKP